MQNVVRITVDPGVDRCFAEDLAAELEVVVAAPAVLEVAQRAEHLIAATVAVPVAIAAGDDVVAGVLESRAGAIGMIRPVVAKLPGANFEEGLSR